MEVPEAMKDPQYIEKKREELRIFFQDVKLPKEMIEKAIENELKPLKTDLNRPYIAAADQSNVKTEQEVMSGQPFTKIDDHGKPYNFEEIKEMLKDNPIIAEKARQIQIMADNENFNKHVAIPFEEINVADYNEMRKEFDDAKGDKDKIKHLNYKNMLSLMTSVSNYKAKCAKKLDEPTSEQSECADSDNDEKEYEAIEKVVSQYTTKSYETRFQETKDMLGKLADSYEEDEISQNSNGKPAAVIASNPILKDSSMLIIKGNKSHSIIKEVQESYAINEAMNIPITSNPAALDCNLKSNKKAEAVKLEEEENLDVQEVFPKTFAAKLKDTEKVLRGINSVLNKTSSLALVSNEMSNNIDANLNSQEVENKNEPQKFDEGMEQTLQNTLEGIFESSNGGKSENNEMEYKEMKNLARNIVEGAENLSTLIREDITNKLNSMNELLNDVNEALENSRKSNIAYEKLKEEGEILRGEIKPAEIKPAEKVNEIQEGVEPNNVSDPQMDSIHDAIAKLNTELKHHEERINQSKARYEQRNDECKTFIKEVDQLLLKSHDILRPMRKKMEEERNKEIAEEIRLQAEAQASIEDKPTTEMNVEVDENVKKPRKELWDIDFSQQNEKHKKIAEAQKEELERSKKINNLLYDIKDKMKDNKEVIRLANNMLRREENRRKGVLENSGKIQELPSDEIDTKAQGDHIEAAETESSGGKDVPPLTDEIHQEVETDLAKKKQSEEMKKYGEAAKERIRQREFQKKVEKELEDMNKTPRMTKEFIKNHCRQHKLYCTPYLNDILYLHFKGFSKIENLEEYTGLKCIFLENNGIQRIEGLDTLSELKCLYLHYNILRKIENLDGCPKLDTLNIDHNFVSKIENLDVVPDLHTLSIAHNMLSAVDDLVHLRLCRNLSVLDLSYNRLEDPLIVDVLADMVILKVLVLTGNPVVRNIPAYRKTLTLRLKELLNLDNRPVFPRDRACAEAWQRGGVQEEIAERRRWIAKDQEKVMESVRYLIRMRDEKKAIREAKEKEEREKAGLSPQEEEKPENKTEESKKDLLEIEGRPVQEDPAEVKIKEGVAVDMLSGSGEDDSTSEESSDDSDNKEDGIETGNIEWCQGDRGNRLVQEITNEPPPPLPDDYWYGYGNIKAKNQRPDTTSDFQAINNLLFNQNSHVGRKGVTKILEESKSREGKKRITEINPEEEKASVSVEKKPLVEIIDVADSKDTDENKTNVKDDSIIEDVTQTDTQIMNKDQTTFTERSEKETKITSNSITVEDNKPSMKKSKTTKKIPIKEIPLETKDNAKESPQKNEENNTKQEVQNKENGDNAASTSEGAEGNVKAQMEGDGVALINYMRRMNTEEIDEDNLDLEPNAEDLEIFAELDREEAERQARIDRGEPPFDPMKLYDKEKMDAYYKEKDSLPAHLVQDKAKFTTYRNDNAFDRIALSQLTAGEKPDESKVKLTHVPGAVLFQYVDNQAPAADVQYEIGEEDVESAPSSGDTDSINIISDTNTSDEEVKEKEEEKVTKKPKNRPVTAASGKPNKKSPAKGNTTSKDKSKASDKNSGSGVEKKAVRKKCDGKSGGQKADRKSFGKSHAHHDNEDSTVPGVSGEQEPVPGASGDTNVATEYPSTSNILPSSYDTMLNLDRKEAKRSIIKTINSYEDQRFPSQGVIRSDMAENARIDQNVASEILDRTLQYEEREMYRQYDVMTSHAGNIDNKTNAIIERMSGELENEYTLPEVSHILEVHMDAAAQRWRAGDFVQFIPGSPSGSLHDVNDDHEATLIASNNDSLCLEDTLTDENVSRMSAIVGDDSGIGNDITMSDTTEGHDKIVEGNDKTQNDNVGDDTLSIEEKVRQVEEGKGKNLEGVNLAIASSSGDASCSGYRAIESDEKDAAENDLNDSKVFESILGDENFMTDVSTDDIFEDCVDDIEAGTDKEDGRQFDRVEQNYSLEMKLALGIEDGKS
ncbi:uncharacterized protein LOC111357283 [Spodoptera litura]|uniref:Dynein axonemal assembly factor 1 homolog n=1 Tax=Spodoptera litura TaxID=69820 RepID=A0A9J7EAY8_SPOLT|nr:uncharacterized protein LOC111357283 [Spodoptera litura]